MQGWGRKKKEALIISETNKLHELSECINDSHFKNKEKDMKIKESNKSK